MNNYTRPLRKAVNAFDYLLDVIVIILALLLFLYSGYSIWFTRSLAAGSFVADELIKYKPTNDSPTLDELQEVNPDVKSWLTIDGTNIDYPVVQGETYTEYLNKSATGEFSLAGAIFLTPANKPDFSDAYNVIYGHHVEGGAMFSDVMNFRDAEYFETHTGGTLWLTDKVFGIELFAYMEIDALDPVVYQYPGGVTHGELPGVVDYILGHSVHTRDPRVTESDSIIVMSTCKDMRTFDRCLLFGKLVPLADDEIEHLRDENQKQQEEIEERIRRKSEGGFPWYPVILGALALLLFLWLLILLLRRRDNGEKYEKEKV